MARVQNEVYRGAGEAQKLKTFELLRQLAVAIERLFSPHCEVVIHDFTDLEHSIIYLEGSLSDRSIGGAATNLLLKRVQAGDTAEDLHGYRTQLADNRVMKSSTIFLRDESGEAYGAFCINYDLSKFVGIQKMMAEFTQIDLTEAVSETLSDDINQTIKGIIAETVGEMGIDGPVLSRDDKVNLVARLDEKGVFQVKKAVPILAEQFGFSRATIYNYLREGRSERGANPDLQDEETA